MYGVLKNKKMKKKIRSIFIGGKEIGNNVFKILIKKKSTTYLCW